MAVLDYANLEWHTDLLLSHPDIRACHGYSLPKGDMVDLLVDARPVPDVGQIYQSFGKRLKRGTMTETVKTS